MALLFSLFSIYSFCFKSVKNNHRDLKFTQNIYVSPLIMLIILNILSIFKLFMGSLNFLVF